MTDTMSARSLLESMRSQSVCYEEWCDVMRDYATVFSTDRQFDKSGSVGGGGGGYGGKGLFGGTATTLTYRVKSQRPEVGAIVKDVFKLFESMREWEELPTGLGLGYR